MDNEKMAKLLEEAGYGVEDYNFPNTIQNLATVIKELRKKQTVYVTVETCGAVINDVTVFEKESDSDLAVIKWRNEHNITSDDEAEALDDNNGTAIKEYVIVVT